MDIFAAQQAYQQAAIQAQSSGLSLPPFDQWIQMSRPENGQRPMLQPGEINQTPMSQQQFGHGPMPANDLQKAQMLQKQQALAQALRR